MRISTKLRFGFFIYAGLVVAVTGFYFLIDRVQGTNNAARDSIYLADQMMKRVIGTIDLHLNELRMFAEFPQIQQNLSDSNRYFEELDDPLRFIADQDAAWTENPSSSELCILTSSTPVANLARRMFIRYYEQELGNPVFSLVMGVNLFGCISFQTTCTSDYYQGDEFWWRQTLEAGKRIGDIVYDPEARGWGLDIARIVYDTEERPIGVIAGVLNLLSLIQEVELQVDRYASTEVMLLTSTGRLLYSSRPFSPFEDISGEAVFTSINATRGSFVLSESAGRRLYTYTGTQMQDTSMQDWIFIVSHRMSDILELTNRNQLLVLYGLIAALMITGVISLLIYRGIMGSLDTLKDAAANIANLDFTVHIPESGEDEFHDVSRRFREMAGNIRIVYDRLREELEVTRSSREEIRYKAMVDDLTGLWNRRYLTETFHSMASTGGGALFFIDLNGFKPVNDTYGHNAGDRVLVEIGNRLSYSVRSNDIAARAGGDEFVLVFQGMKDRRLAAQMADRLMESLALPVTYEGSDISVGCAVGIAFFSSEEDDAEAVIQSADSAMYVAKGTQVHNRSDVSFGYFFAGDSEPASE